MNELGIYYDKNKKIKVGETIQFEPIKVGEETKKTIYLFNEIDYELTVKIDLTGKDVSLSSGIKKIRPKGMGEVEFHFTPEVDRMTPIKAKMNVKIYYLITT